jgi:clan AA aspartic protease (TIGR02281 family)
MHPVSVSVRTLGIAVIMALALPLLSISGYAEQQAAYRVSDYTAGVQAYRLGDYESAIHYFKRTLAQDTQNSNAHYYLALSLDNLGLTSDAAAEYAQVINQGKEATIVAYAKNRLEVIKPSAPKGTSSSNIAMIASGNQLSQSIYRGTASQVAVPLKSNKNALIVDATLTQGPARTDGAFIIDTGATYTSISQEMAQQLGMNLNNSETVFITTANGRIEVPKVTIQTLNVNGLEAHNVEATVIPVRKGSSFSGLLGLSFIRQFVVTIDPAANQLIFRRN